MLIKLPFLILLLLTPLFYLDTAYAEVYKWIDDDGKVIYGDKPATNDAEKIKIKNAPEKDHQYQERHNKQQKLLNIIQEERNEKISLKKQEKENKAQQQAECSDAIKKLKAMKDSSFLYSETDDPNNPIFLSDEERNHEESKYEEYIKNNC